ncbi:MAG TPA: ATP-binding cassette domain-containing protein [Chloroflexota bacterium]|nr:ATP-binding cassette domain-containing protein [Chloroflexota bacterium]
MIVLAFESVSKEFQVGSPLGRDRGRILALDRVSFELSTGETVGLVGESGAGKSTVARIASGLLRPNSGSVVAFGKRVDRLSDRRLRPMRARIGFIFQDPYASLNPRRRLGETLGLPFQLHSRLSRSERREEVLRLLDRVGLSPAGRFVDKFPHQLSGGQRQRVAIARAIALRPALLIADEPVSSLDVSVAGQILNLLRDVQAEIGSSVLFISHDLSLVQALCDRVIVMYEGRIVEEGSVDDLFQRPRSLYTRQLLDSRPEKLAESLWP